MYGRPVLADRDHLHEHKCSAPFGPPCGVSSPVHVLVSTASLLPLWTILEGTTSTLALWTIPQGST